MISGMPQFYSRPALVVAIAYAILFAILLIATRHFTEPEGIPFVLLVIGFPWVLACILFPKLPFFVAVILNITTVYAFALALNRVFSKNSAKSW
jgi:hypothetical protein